MLILSAFVEFGRETTYTKSSPMQNSKFDLKWYLMGFVFILLAYFVIRL